MQEVEANLHQDGMNIDLQLNQREQEEQLVSVLEVQVLL